MNRHYLKRKWFTFWWGRFGWISVSHFPKWVYSIKNKFAPNGFSEGTFCAGSRKNLLKTTFITSSVIWLLKCVKCADSDHPVHVQTIIRAFSLHRIHVLQGRCPIVNASPLGRWYAERFVTICDSTSSLVGSRVRSIGLFRCGVNAWGEGGGLVTSFICGLPFSTLPGIWVVPFFQQKVYDWPDFSWLVYERPRFYDIPVYPHIFRSGIFRGCLFSW